MFGKACEFGLGAFKATAELQISAVFLGQEIADRPLDHAIAVIGQFHIGDDFGLQQANGIARHRVAETGMEFLSHSRPTDNIAAFHDADLQARLCKIERTDKAVMATANDYGIIFFGHVLLQSGLGRCSSLASGMSSRTWAQKPLRQTSLSDSGPIEKDRLAIPCCTRVISTVSSAFT